MRSFDGYPGHLYLALARIRISSRQPHRFRDFVGVNDLDAALSLGAFFPVKLLKLLRVLLGAFPAFITN